jgi:hypothetical protein
MKTTLSLAVLAAAAAFGAHAQQPGVTTGTAAATAPGMVAAGDTVTITAKVVGIDAAKRVVTLQGPQGNLFQVVAGPEVRNFDQIKVGNDLVVTHTESLVVDLKKGGDGIRERREIVAADRAPAGAAPGAAIGGQVQVVADVIAINPRAQTVTLRGVKHVVEMRVKDPEQLKLIKVGDQVEATYTSAVAVAITPGAAKK